jgi:hypothetical protein
VLVLSQHFWPESLRINDVVLDLQRAGCQVSVLTGQPNYPGGQVFEGYRAMSTGVQVHQGLTIHRVPLVPRGRGGALRPWLRSEGSASRHSREGENPKDVRADATHALAARHSRERGNPDSGPRIKSGVTVSFPQIGQKFWQLV